MRRASVTLLVIVTTSCSFADLNLEGKTGPCAPGWIGEVGQVCALPKDAGADSRADAMPTRDAAIDVVGDTRQPVDAGTDAFATDIGTDTVEPDTSTDSGGALCSSGDGLIAHYTFEDGSLANQAGSGSNGLVIAGSPTVVGDAAGDALAFDGMSCVSFGDLDAPPVFSLAVWSRSSVIDDEFHSIFMKAYDYGFELVGPLLTAAVGDGAAWVAVATSPRPIAVDRWYHFGMTFNGSFLSLYVDGALVASQAAVELASSNTLLQIGCWAGNTEYLNGTVDNARVYDRVLTELEMSELFSSEC